MPQLTTTTVVACELALVDNPPPPPVDVSASWSTVGGHKIGAWFASLGSRRGRRKAAFANGLPLVSPVHPPHPPPTSSGNNNTTHRSFTLGTSVYSFLNQ